MTTAGSSPGPCAKTRVSATLVIGGRHEVFGTNSCLNPQPVCPREPGEGYEKCRSICQQRNHAEVDAIMNALHGGCELGQLEGAEIYVQGHTHACESCQTFARSFGVEIHIGPPPIRATGFTHQEVADAARFARRERFRRNGLDRSYDETVQPSGADLLSAACILEWVGTQHGLSRFPAVRWPPTGLIQGTLTVDRGAAINLAASEPMFGDRPLSDFVTVEPSPMPVRRPGGRLAGLFPDDGDAADMTDTGEWRAE